MIPHYLNHVLKPLHFPLFLSKLKEKVYTKIGELTAEYAVSKEPVIYRDRLGLNYKKIDKGENWGELFDCAWFHFEGTVPKTAQGNKVVLMIDIGGEGLLFDANGDPVQGVTNGSSIFDRGLGEPCKRVIPWLERAEGGEKVDIWVDGANNDLFGNLSKDGFVQADIMRLDEQFRTLYYDCFFLLDLAKSLDDTSARYYAVLHCLNNVMNAVTTDFNPADVEKALKLTRAELAKKNGDADLTLSAIGHGHLDLAWLWPIREGRRKAARTLSTQLKLIERYPDYIYNISQPQQLEWIKQDYPALYQRVLNAVSDGRFEAQGGTFVECDTYMPCGEALVRQFLVGKKMFRKELNVTPEVLWLPDTFGYSAAIPQIMAKCGMKYFITIKLSWSAFQDFPYHTFRWKGVDGTTVLAHMPPTGTYNDSAMPTANKKAEKEYSEKGLCDKAMILFGIGDGGGGPSPRHLELIERQKNVSGLAPLQIERSQDFFTHIAENEQKYHIYNGELYVQNHQGTLTSVAMVKYFNRLLEGKLKQAEYLCSIAGSLQSFPYPHVKLEELWKTVLLYQFHDILPGSSIKRVYDECKEQYLKVSQEIDDIIESSQYVIKTGEGKSFYNFSPFVNVTEVTANGKNEVVSVMPFSNICRAEHREYSFRFSDEILENDRMRIVFDRDGSIISLISKENNFEYIPKDGKANVLNVYSDMGDAWDMSIQYMAQPKESFRLVKTSTVMEENKLVRTSEYVYRSSTLIQKMILAGYNGYVECQTEADWQEKDKMLRADFAVDIDCKQARCDMQFGSYTRDVGDNSSLDYARFEMCAHKYIDISQGDLGFALLNNCKYGHHVSSRLISLNLIRCKEHPNGYYDLGGHKFSYALLPHRESGGVVVEQAAYNFNNPILMLDGNTPESFIAMSENCQIIIEHIKTSEDDNGYIVRLYESGNCHVETNISLGFHASEAFECNLLEEDRRCLPVRDNKVALKFLPREIKTIYIMKEEP